MHPSLALSKLSELPLQLKKLAKAAAAGSLQDLLVIIPLRATMLPKTHSLLLPVYYALLDPKDITPLRDPDRLHTDDATERVRLVVLALACLDEAVCCKDVVPEAVRPDLWDRAWLWIQFLVEFDMSPAVWPSRGTPQEVYARILYACAGEHTFDSVQSTPAAVLLTPGLYILITYLWRHLLECKSSSDSEDPVGWVTSFLTRAALRTPAIVDDLLEGAGSWDSVAQLIITQLRRAFPSSQDPLTYKATLLLDGVDSFLVFAYADGESPLREALFQQGVVPLLTTACLVLSKQLVPRDLPSLIERILWFLGTSFFMHTKGHTAMVSSLRAGLLPLIISCASGPYRNSKDVERGLEAILRCIIGSSCFASVLLQLKDSLAELSILGLELEPALRHFGLEEKWTKFKQHPLGYRLGLVTPSSRKNMKDVEAFTGCDNLKCARIKDKPAMKRCSNCLITHYCDQKCQKADWEDGHRERCKTIAARHFEYAHQTSAADRALHRTLLRLDYTSKRHLVLAGLIECIRNDDTVALVRFSYLGGEAEVTVLGLKDLATLEQQSPKGRAWVEYYREDAARAVRSGGLVQIHVQELPSGKGGLYEWGRVVPLHLSTRSLYEGAAAFEAEFPGVITRNMTNRGHDPVVFSAAVTKLMELSNSLPGVFWTH